MGKKSRSYFVGRGLTRTEAAKRGAKKVKGDYRGIKYNAKTGKVTYT